MTDEELERSERERARDPASVLARMCAMRACLAGSGPSLARMIDEELFDGDPPRVVTFVEVDRACAAIVGREPMPPAAEHELHGDRVLFPDGLPKFLPTIALLAEIIDWFDEMIERFPELMLDEPDQTAASLDAQARSVTYQLVGAIQVLGHQLVVVDLARHVGLPPVPHRHRLRGGGSA